MPYDTTMTPVQKMAQIALTICRVNIDEAGRAACANFSDCHDHFDANLALFGAFASEYFAEPQLADEAVIDELNEVSNAVDALIVAGGLK